MKNALAILLLALSITPLSAQPLGHLLIWNSATRNDDTPPAGQTLTDEALLAKIHDAIRTKISSDADAALTISADNGAVTIKGAVKSDLHRKVDGGTDRGTAPERSGRGGKQIGEGARRGRVADDGPFKDGADFEAAGKLHIGDSDLADGTAADRMDDGGPVDFPTFADGLAGRPPELDPTNASLQ